MDKTTTYALLFNALIFALGFGLYALILFFGSQKEYAEEKAASEEKTEVTVPPDEVQCPRCGAVNPSRNSMCVICGYKLK